MASLLTIDAARMTRNFNHSERFLILVLVQDWVFQENMMLLHFQEMDQNTIARLEHACLELRSQLQLATDRGLALESALRHAEDANFALAAANHAYFSAARRRVRRRLTYEEEVAILTDSSEGEQTELEELPSDPEDAEL